MALVFLVLFLGIEKQSAAETLILEHGVGNYAGAGDTSIFQEVPDNSAGGAPVMYVGVTRYNDKRRGLLRFDVSQIPAGAIIQNVQLKLAVDRSRTASDAHALHRMTASWNPGASFHESLGEGGQGVPAAEGDATWNSAIHTHREWQMAGGDFESEASATATLLGAGTSGIFTAAGLVADVQMWVNDPATNNGWALLGDEDGYFNARRIHSSSGPEGLRPQLTIVWRGSSEGGGEQLSFSGWAMY